jgi:hypothetical protein
LNWYLIAQRDWSLYKDKSRIAVFVENAKITALQYEQITGEIYTPPAE